jgi:CheY-like chemotaxis protein
MARVLVVEDEDVLRGSLAHLLRHRGWDVRDARSGNEALEVGQDFHPDVLIADWMLENHLHGLEVSRLLRGANPTLRTIVITGFPSHELREEAEREPAVVGFLEKPFSFEDLEEVLLRATLAYEVLCSHCRALVVTTPRIGDADAALMAEHLRGTHPHLVPDDPPVLAHLLRQFTVRRRDSP